MLKRENIRKTLSTTQKNKKKFVSIGIPSTISYLDVNPTTNQYYQLCLKSIFSLVNGMINDFDVFYLISCCFYESWISKRIALSIFKKSTALLEEDYYNKGIVSSFWINLFIYCIASIKKENGLEFSLSLYKKEENKAIIDYLIVISGIKSDCFIELLLNEEDIIDSNKAEIFINSIDSKIDCDLLHKEIFLIQSNTNSSNLFYIIAECYGNNSVEEILLALWLLIKPSFLELKFIEVDHPVLDYSIDFSKFIKYLISAKDIDDINLLQYKKYQDLLPDHQLLTLFLRLCDTDINIKKKLLNSN